MLPVDDPPNAVPDIFRRRFECCFRNHYAQLLAFAMRRVSTRETAEDVVADTFAVAWRRRDRIPDPALPWLYAIAGHVIANQYRSTSRRHNLDMRLAHESGAAARSDPAESLGRRDAFSAAFALLSEPEREVLRLIAWDGLDTRDAARVSAARRAPSGCGCTAPAASSRSNSRREGTRPERPAPRYPTPPRRFNDP